MWSIEQFHMRYLFTVYYVASATYVPKHADTWEWPFANNIITELESNEQILYG